MALLRDSDVVEIRTRLETMTAPVKLVHFTQELNLEYGREARLLIPAEFRVGHEAHFAQVARRFLGYAGNPQSMPAWERSYMLAKYYVSTKGVELANS